MVTEERMKHKMSVSVDEELLLSILEKMRENRMFRSKSHVVEEALREYLGDRRA